MVVNEINKIVIIKYYVLFEKGAGEVDNHEDYIDSVDILCQLNSDFYENLNSKVWQERKKALEELGEILARTPLLANGDYGDLLSILEKVR